MEEIFNHLMNQSRETFKRAQGPGGQNVNKVSSAVELRVNLEGLQEWGEDFKERLIKEAHSWVTVDQHLIIVSQKHRSQDQNRKEVRFKLKTLIEKAMIEPKERLKKEISEAEHEERLLRKKQAGQIKKERQCKIFF